MGSGASSAADIKAASDEQLQAALKELSPEDMKKLQDSVAASKTKKVEEAAGSAASAGQEKKEDAATTEPAAEAVPAAADAPAAEEKKEDAAPAEPTAEAPAATNTEPAAEAAPAAAEAAPDIDALLAEAVRLGLTSEDAKPTIKKNIERNPERFVPVWQDKVAQALEQIAEAKEQEERDKHDPVKIAEREAQRAEEEAWHKKHKEEEAQEGKMAEEYAAEARKRAEEEAKQKAEAILKMTPEELESLIEEQKKDVAAKHERSMACGVDTDDALRDHRDKAWQDSLQQLRELEERLAALKTK